MIVVVGVGLAGTVAAARLVSLGQKVTVIGERPGTTAMHSGGWLLGPERLKALGFPAHRLDEAFEFLQAGLPEQALVEGPLKLIDTDGVTREVDAAPLSHTVPLPPRSAAVDLMGLGHPFAEMCSSYERLEVDWPHWPDCFGRSYAAAAARIEADPTQLHRLIAALQNALVGRPIAGLLLPPVLGLTQVEADRRTLENALGLPVAEALGTLPSTPGVRLWSALARWRQRLAEGGGLTELTGRVSRVDLAARQVHLPNGPLAFTTLILATGGPIPGGLSSDEDVRECLANLRTHPELSPDWQRATRPTMPYDAPLFRVGVAVDETFRPTTHDGKVQDSSVFAIGDLVGGADLVIDRCSSGRALLGGYLAAEAAARQEEA